jgi:drug/metabolite transporter (DMT)-like permease
VTPLAVLLVLISAAAHAYWNYLLKRAGGTRAFIALSKAAEAAVFLPVALVLASRAPAGTIVSALPFIAVGTFFVLAGYVTLGAAYRVGELSFIYPIARGAALLVLPPLGWLTFGERVGPLGWVAITAIVGGVVVMQLPALRREAWRELASHLRGPATLLALLMAFILGTSTIWDKHAVRSVSLWAYFYGYTLCAGIGYLAWVAWAEGVPAVRAEWRTHRVAAVAVGVLNTVSYALALLALRTGGSTYVVGLRQVSIAVGVWLGARLLGEHVSSTRRLGVALLLGGCLLMAWGR